MTGFNWKLFGVLTIVIMVLSMGYLMFPEEEDEGLTTVRMIIDFGGHGELHAGNLTIWKDGEFVNSEMTSNNTTIFRFDRVRGENQTVLDVLSLTAEWGNFTMDHTTHSTERGTFVESIAGVENGDLTWQYYINDEYGVLASDRKRVRDGDTIRWEYE